MAKAKIENIENVHVDNVGDVRSYAIGWSIGSDRFHVWVKGGKIEETIYKNPDLSIPRGAPGHYETRQLDRTSKTQSEIFEAVLAIANRDGLVDKAIAAKRASMQRNRRSADLTSLMSEIEKEVLQTWKSGRAPAADLLDQYNAAQLELSGLVKQMMDAA